MVLRVMYVIELLETEEGGIELVDPSWCPEEGPPRKKVKSPPVISPTGSSTSLYSGGSSSIEWTTTGTSLEMQGTRVTRTQYGFRTLQESSAKMCLKVTGYPLPDITWYMDDVLLKNDERHTFYSDDEGFFALTIDPVQTEDTGRYTCVATNEYGQASTSAFFRVLKVEKKSAVPSFIKLLVERLDCKEGDVISFNCEVDGWPEPELIWLVDDQPLRPSHDFRIQYDGQYAKLEIRDAQPDDTGTYTVRISNEYGNAMSRSMLTVASDPDKNHVPPEFQAMIEDMECNEGDTVKFKAVLTGDPVPEVIWYINGVPLTESEKIRFINEDGICLLTIKDVSRHFDGIVTCQGKNRLGSGSCEARLRVRVPPMPPQFERPLEDRVITEGGAVMFELDVIGYPEPIVDFRLKGRPLVHGEHGVDIRAVDGHYRVTVARCMMDAHDGELLARATNEHGQAESRARLTVEPEEEESRSAPTFIKDIEDQTVKQGQEATFDTVVRGSPMPSISWFLNGQKLDAGITPGVVSIQADGAEHKIVLDSTQWAGTVLCRAENHIGRFETKARLIVLPAEKQKKAPMFRQPLADRTETEGATAVFEVTAEAEPPPKFRWTLNGTELTTDTGGRVRLREFEGSSKLELDGCKLEDGGMLECSASNSEGNALTTARFSVQRKPKAPELDMKPRTVQTERGEQAIFEAHADAMPAPEYAWSVGGRRIFALADGAHVELDEVTGVCKLILDTNQFSDSGLVVVNASNKLGSDECSARLIVVEPMPTPPIKKSRFSDEEESKTSSTESQVTQVQNVQKTGTGEEPMEGVEVEGKPVSIVQEQKPKPEFKQGLDQLLECRQGQELVVEVKIQNADSVKWFMDDQILQDGTRGVHIEEKLHEHVESFSRVVLPPDMQQTGQQNATPLLMVEAANEAGTSESSTRIRVVSAGLVEPRFTQQLQSASVKEGEQVEMSATVDGQPAPSVKWLLNEKEMEATDTNMQITSGPGGRQSLRIQETSAAQHSGRMVVHAENSQGSAESTADVTVQPKPGPPYFSREPQNHEVTDEVESVKFSAIVHGNPLPAVYWYLKGECLVSGENLRVKHDAVSGKTSIRLFHPNTDDSGEVKVVAQNVHGQAEAGATLKVDKRSGIPRFLTDMNDRQVIEGDKVKFSAKIEAFPEPEVQWTFNGEPVKADNIKVSSEGNLHMLEINDVQLGQAGDLACTAKNSAGSKRQNAHLTVKESGGAPVFVRSIEERLVEVNKTLVMEAQLGPGVKPTPEVRWLKDGQQLQSDEHLKLSAEANGVHKLIITRAAQTDKGRITLQAENKFGTAECSANIGVQSCFQEKPKFLSDLGPITVKEGDSLYAKVLVSGDPIPETKWYINNDMVGKTEDTELTSEGGVHTLVIHGCTTDMTGKIKCVAHNRWDRITIEGKLTVMAPVPVEFETALCDATCREGDTLKLKAVLLGEPMPDVTWFINGKKLEELQNIKIHADAGTYTVIIKNITIDYSGLVVCEAVNEFGKASSQATLKVLPRGEPPDFLEWLSNVRARPGSQVQHKVVYTGDPRPSVAWFINGQEVHDSSELSIRTDSNTSTLVVNNFNPDKHVGEIICKAENDAGEVSCTANMATYTSDMFTESESGSMVEGQQMHDLLEAERQTMRTPTPIMAPAFITKIKDTRAQRGHQAIFECVVPDTKGVCCKWLKDGKEIELIARIRVQVQTIEGFTTSELVIDEVEPEDAGKYTVVVENVAGSAVCEAELTVVETMDKSVQIAPEFVVRLQDKLVHESERCTFECKVTGLPEPTCSWYRDEERLTEEAHQVHIENVKGVQRLTIDSVEVTQTGTYTCRAENIMGRTQTNATLRVETQAPQFTRTLSDQEAQIGGTRVSIQHDETNTHWRMVIKDVLEGDLRQYRAVAKNSVGQAVSECTVRASEPGVERPRIVDGLKRLRVKEHETAEMCVRVLGTGKPGQPPPEVQWFRNGEPLQPDGQKLELVEYREAGEFKLIIHDCLTEDAGDYGVRISNKVGQDTSHAQIAVDRVEEEAQRPEFTEPLKDVSVKLSESVMLRVTVIGKPEPQLEWLKDGEPVQIDGQHIVRKDDEAVVGRHSLTLQDACLEDAGLYTCKASNKAGEAESRGRLSVQEEIETPRFTEGLKDMHIKEDESATLSVTVTGKPKPEVHWYKDGAPAQVDTVHVVQRDGKQGQHALTLNNVTTSDAGTYTCKAVNKAGQAETNTKLNVQEVTEAPKFVEGLRPVEVREGESGTLSVVVSGKPEPKLEWYKDGYPVNIDGDHIVQHDDFQGRHRLVIKDAKTRDAGSYTCKAVNNAGQVVTQAKFGVIEDVKVPKFIQELKPLDVNEGDTGTMTVKVDGKPEPKIEWFKDGRPVQIDGQHIVRKDEPDGRHSLTIKNARPEDAGTYSCKASNKAGQSVSEANFGVQQRLEEAAPQQAEPMFLVPLEPQTVREGETAEMSCKVNAEESKPDIRWYRDEKPIVPGQEPNVVIEQLADGTLKMRVLSATKAEIGMYRCEAVNVAGRAQTSAPLKYAEEMEVEHKFEQAEPIFLRPLEPKMVREGETAEMSCKVNVESKPDIHWYRDEKPIVPGQEPNVIIEELADGTQTLRVLHASATDMGMYRCEAVNPTGRAKTQAPLRYAQERVIEQPQEEHAPLLRWRRTLQDQQVSKGTLRVVFECQLEPTVLNAVKRVDWLKDGAILANKMELYSLRVEQLQDGTQRLLFDREAHFDHIGVYRCVATDASGNQIWTEARLGVIAPRDVEEMAPGPPEFVELLKSCTTTIGGTAVLRCKVKGNPRPTISWSRQGYGPLVESERISTEYHEDGTIILTLTNADMDDTGEYRCDAENDFGTAWTEGPIIVAAEGSLPTEGEAPDFIEPVRPITVKVGDTGILEGRISGLPFPEVKWYKGEQLITPGANPRYRLENLPDGTQRLIITNAQMSDMDDYRCEATNKYGDVWSDVTLTVQEPEPEEEPSSPYFVKGLQEVRATEGEQAEFECIVKGWPTPEIKWYKDSDEIGPEDVHFNATQLPDGTCRLTLPTARITDAGVFRCSATNPSGTARTEAPLRVLLTDEAPMPTEVTPKFLQELKPVQAKEGDEAVFECKVSGVPQPEIKWYKDGVPLGLADGVKFEALSDGTQRLIIPKSRLDDQGNYCCEATNPAGTVTTKAPLSVIQEKPTEEEAKPMEEEKPLGEEAKMEWEEAKPTEEEAKPSEEEAKPMEEEKPLEKTAKVGWEEAKQKEEEAKPAEEEAKPMEEEKPPKELAKMEWEEAEPKEEEVKPFEEEAKPMEEQKPSEEEAKMGWEEAKPKEEAKPAEEEAKPMDEEKPSEEAAKMGWEEAEPKEEEVKPFEEEAKPVEEQKPSEEEAKMGWEEAKPKEEEEPKPAEEEAKPMKEEKPPEEAGKMGWAEVKPKEEEVKPFEEEAKPLEEEKPLEEGAKVGEELEKPKAIEVEAPTVRKGLQDQSLRKGSPLVLDVEMDGSPTDVQWFRDGYPLDEASGAVAEDLGGGHFRLTIPELANDGDFGRYAVKVSNEAGDAESVANITEKAPAEQKPEIVRGLVPISVRPGEPTKFEVEVKGPVRSVKWYKNGREIEQPETEQDGNCYRLIISSAGADDEADYKVVVANLGGEAQSEAPLHLIKPLRFVRPLEDVTVPKSHRAVLSAETDRAPAFAVKWFKDGQELRPSETGTKAQPKRVSDTKFRLEVPDTDADDTADYSIKVFDREDEPGVECSCALTVLLPEEKPAEPPRFERPLREQTIPEEDELVLEVETFGKPHTVRWYKNGQQLSPSDRSRMEKLGPDRFRLVVPSALQDDTGDYACEIANDAGLARCEARQTVEPFPEFIRPLQDLTVVEGERAEFWCETNLRSIPHTVKWFCNGQELKADGRHELKVENSGGIFRMIIKSANKSDGGTVRIKLENTAGKAYSEAKLTVQNAKKELPKIVKALLDQIVAEGESLTFEVQIAGDVDQIRWLKDGQPLDKDGRVKMVKVDDQTYRMTIPSAELSDAGEFEVQAINDAGKAVSSAHAEVDRMPRIVQGLVPTDVDEGDEHVFRVETSAPIRTVKWFKNGKEIDAPPGARIRLKDVSPKKYELVIENALLDDVANYRVVLSNRAGECESSADLGVHKPSVFKLRKGLQDVTIDEGQPLELVSELDGDEPSGVKWFKNGEEITPDDHIKILSNPSTGIYSLSISSALASDGGAYRVVFENPRGGELSSGSVAHVRAKKRAAETSPALFLSPLEDVELPEGETLNLKCKVGGQPLPEEVQWFKDEIQLKPDGDRITIRLGLDGTATLRIRDVLLGEAGQFKATASNEAGQAETKCHVKVLSREPEPMAPKFVIPLRSMEGTPGERAEFTVKVRGVPTPELQWILNDAPIDFARETRFKLEDMSNGNWTMTIQDIQETDFGTLRCVATNAHGRDECDAQFDPSADWLAGQRDKEGWPPRFNVPLWGRRVPEGQPMAIECHVDAKPTADIEWFYKGKLLEASDEVEMRNTPDGACRVRIAHFREEHVGEYLCAAKNLYGVADTRAHYNVEVEEVGQAKEKKEFAPRFNPGLTDQQLNAGDQLRLNCHVEAVPPATVQFYKDGVPMRALDRCTIDYSPETGDCTLTVQDATEADAGAYRCVAQNAHGSTNTACQVNVRAQKAEPKKEGAEPCFTRGLVDQYIERGDTLVFTCAVTGDPEPEIKWFCNGKLLKPSDRVLIEQLPGGECKLTIKDCSMTDEGIYRCEATSLLGTAKTQATAHVEAGKKVEKPKVVEGEAPHFIVPLEDLSVFVGSAIEMECKCAGVPMPIVKWSKDGRPLMEDVRFEWDNRPDQGHYRLRIRETTLHDEGTYRCVATNDSGQASTKAFVRVDEGIETRAPVEEATPAQISVKLADQRVQEGQPLKLHCKVEGIPTPELVWYKDGEQVRPSERVQLERDVDGNAYLIIPKCTLDDDGVYRVIATNPHGTAYDKCTITVKKAALEEGPLVPEGAKEMAKAPKLVEPLENVKCPEGTEFVLRCRFSGEPAPTIKWFKDGDRLIPYERMQIADLSPEGWCELRVPASLRSDSGNYRCVAENPFGSARSACEVQVLREKKPKEDLQELAKEFGRAPGFTIPLTVKHAKPGDRVIFECLPYGKPFPDIKWLKDGIEIVPSDGVKIEALPDGTQQLTLENVDFPAEGYYRCVATNEHGTASTRAGLTIHGEKPLPKRAEEEEGPVESKPRIRPGLYNQSIHQGSPLEMQICAIGFPTPTVEWLKDGQPLAEAAAAPDSRITIYTDERGAHHLVIVNCQPEDEGDYQVVARNPLGEATSTGTLSVIRPRGVEGAEEAEPGGMPFPPGFIRQVKNKHVFTKMPTIFDCIVVGYPPPDVDWYHNGKKITPGGRIKIQVAGGGSHALLITDTCLEDAGEYVAIARNEHGTATSSAILDVTAPYLDKIKFNNLEDVTPYLTEEYGFKKTKFKAIPTPPDRGPFIKEVTGHYLTLSWIPTKRSPPRYPQVTYVIEIRELPYKEWSLLDYNIPEPVCKVRNLELGKSYQFRVRAENIYGISDPSPASPPSRLMAPPAPVLDKYKRVIPLLDPYAERALDLAHAEQYACTPWFAPGVQEKRFVAENDVSSITLHYSGYPDPKITWKFRGWSIEEGPTSNIRVSTHAGTETTITFLGFNKANAGQYTCMAENQYGKAEQDLLIEAASRPKFIQGLTNREFPSDRPLRLDVRTEGNPAPEIKWLKDWRPLVDSSRVHIVHEPGLDLRSLVIDQPIWSDSGIYSCMAMNDAGQAVTSCTITIEIAEMDFMNDIKLRALKKTVKLERGPLRDIYDIQEADVEEYSASEAASVQNGS
uniref:Muscle M-line assembly protein unc-89 n=1 Tax=Globodera rostochiensis TaxID=31243 RepID=A0A914I5C8_GLORO